MFNLSDYFNVSNTPRAELNSADKEYVLHVKEWMKQRINELRGEDHKAREVGLEGVVDVIVVVGRDFEVLFQLRCDCEKPEMKWRR